MNEQIFSNILKSSCHLSGTIFLSITKTKRRPNIPQQNKLQHLLPTGWDLQGQNTHLKHVYLWNQMELFSSRHEVQLVRLWFIAMGLSSGRMFYIANSLLSSTWRPWLQMRAIYLAKLPNRYTTPKISWWVSSRFIWGKSYTLGIIVMMGGNSSVTK